MTTESACRHDTSERSTLTVTLLSEYRPYGLWSIACKECGLGEVAPASLALCSLFSAERQRVTERFVLLAAESLNCLETDSSSSPPERTSTARPSSHPDATSGREDCPPTSLKSAQSSYAQSSTPSSPSSAKEAAEWEEAQRQLRESDRLADLRKLTAELERLMQSAAGWNRAAGPGTGR
jgi:hypothetical protein